jgi:hypothetical protein
MACPSGSSFWTSTGSAAASCTFATGYASDGFRAR